jgi:hypothetical protein
MTAPDPLECLNSRAAADKTTCGEYPFCPNDDIKAGDDYVRHATFPGDEANSSNRVVVHCICSPCHTHYGRPMPLRRAERKKARRG